MRINEFGGVLKDVTEVSDEQADRLFEARCDDDTLAGRNTSAWIHFDRKALS